MPTRYQAQPIENNCSPAARSPSLQHAVFRFVTNCPLPNGILLSVNQRLSSWAQRRNRAAGPPRSRRIPIAPSGPA